MILIQENLGIISEQIGKHFASFSINCSNRYKSGSKGLTMNTRRLRGYTIKLMRGTKRGNQNL